MRDPVVRLIIAILTFTALMIGCATLFSSCKVVKGLFQKEQSVQRSDSTSTGQVSVSEKNTQTEWEWFKNTLLYAQQPKAGDTIVNQNYYTLPAMPAPKVIIMEGGKGQQLRRENNWDSMWNVRLSRLEEMIIEKTKTKDVQGFTTTQLLGAAVVIIAISVLAGKLSFKK